MCLQVEATEVGDGLREKVEEAMRDVTKLRGQVQVVRPGSLPNDGKVIEDARSYR
jgi:phenylacetate-CoA ligase